MKLALVFLVCLLAACAAPPPENVGTATSHLSAAASNVLAISDLYAEYGWGANGVTYSNAADRCVRSKPTSPQTDKLFVRFDLSGINCGSVASAVLNVTTRDESGAAGNFDLTVRRLLVAYDPAAVGWKYRTSGVQWGGLGATGAGDVSADSASFHVGYGTVAHAVDVTSLVASWWGGAAHGLIITSPGDHAWIVQGSLSLTVTCAEPPPVCGDGVKGGAETCDDGNVLPGDGCSSSCGVEVGYACTGAPSACATVCGDGIVAGTEGCDDGNAISTDGCAACVPASCGDGLVWAGHEQCDDANAIDTDACVDCVLAFCGDGFVGPGEACDDGNDVLSDACAGCEVAVCGDGIVRVGVEECDDGNAVDHDGCSADCLAEVCSCEVP